MLHSMSRDGMSKEGVAMHVTLKVSVIPTANRFTQADKCVPGKTLGVTSESCSTLGLPLFLITPG